MKHIVTLLVCICLIGSASAQDRHTGKAPVKNDLPDLKKSIRAVQGNVGIYTQNYGNHSQEHDVNSIILDIEKYIDSMPKSRGYSDQLLMKQFNPLRHFFLTTTNKTTVATTFLYSGSPYQFCLYGDSAIALHLYAVRDGDTYNLGKTTEKRIVKSAFENCLLPSLKALEEFKPEEVKYVAVSVYYGCKDTREGASGAVTSFCLTIVARTSDLQQYGAGLITIKGLVTNSEVYLSEADDAESLHRIQINVD